MKSFTLLRADYWNKLRNNCFNYRITILCILVIGIKLGFFVLDPQPQFFLGDSATYLHTAINGGMPIDRSFVYGFLIRYFTIYGRSLTPLIFVQVISSTGLSLLLYYVIRKYFNVRASLAIISACCCALDPMQLYYERAVMTENFSTFVYAICLFIAFEYLSKARIYLLVMLAVSCTVLLSFKINYLLSSIIICCLPPILLLFKNTFKRIKEKQLSQGIVSSRWEYNKASFYKFLIQSTVAIGLLLTLHHFYKRLNGYLLNMEPAYMHTDGLFMIAGIAPLLTSADSEDERFSSVIDSFDKETMQDNKHRPDHRFIPGYLVSKLSKEVPDLKECNSLSRKTAINALMHSPFKSLIYGCSIYYDYFDKKQLEKRIKESQGCKPDLPEEFIGWLRLNYSLAVTPNWGKILTLTKNYQLKFRYWNYLLVLGPFISLFGFVISRERNFSALLLIMLTSLSLLPSTCLFSVPDYRYFHIFGFISPIIFAVIADQIWTYITKESIAS